MSTAKRFETRYTIDDYVTWEGEWELWYGTAVSMSPGPFGPHERCVSRIARALGNQIEANGCNCEVYTNLDWLVSEDTVVRPDTMVVCGEQPQQHLETTPSVIVEVLSPSTAEKDRSHKLDLYQTEGVAHYLIADTNDLSIQHFILIDGKYAESATQPELQFSIHDQCSFRIKVDAMFG